MKHACLLLTVLVGVRPVAGQGLPFHTQSALTTAFEERGLRAFSMIQTRGDATISVSPLVVLPFAPHQRVTTFVGVPILSKRVTDGRYSSTGIGDVTLSVKWAFFVRNQLGGTTRLAIITSATLPTGSTGATFNNGASAPRSLQLGKGAVSGGATLVGTLTRGRWGVNADVGHVRHATDDGFHFGPVTRYDVAVGFRIPAYIGTIRTRTLQLYLEWNGSVAGKSYDAGSDLPNSGGHVAYLSPGLQWVLLPQLLIEGSVQIPAMQNFNGTQSDFGARLGAGARFLFF